MNAARRLDSFAAELAMYRDDPIAFCEHILDREVSKHVGQTKWLTLGYKTENCLVTGNRWGKSEASAMKAIYKSAYRVGWDEKRRYEMMKRHEAYHCLLAAPTADQSRIVWAKAHSMLQAPKAAWLVKSVKMTPFPTIELINGAVIQARSTAGNGHHLLGHTYDHFAWDEAAFEPKFTYVRDNVIRNRLIDRAGVLDFTSTGNGRNDFGKYFLAGMSQAKSAEKIDRPDYAQAGATWENPFIPHDRVAKNADRMSDRMRMQTIEGAIIEGGGDYFNAEDLTDAVNADLNDMLKVHAVDEEDIVAWCELFPDAARETPWRLRFPSHRYVTFWDLADKRDWTVGTTWDISTQPKATMVEFERFQKKGWKFICSRIRDRHRRYRTRTGIDATGVGDVVYSELADIINEEDAIIFTKPMKDAMLDNWRIIINLRQAQWAYIPPWVEEHGYYSRDDERLVKDCVMSGAGAAWMMRRGTAFAAPASVLR